MVKKLYKHEFLSLLRWLIPVDLGCLVMAAIARLSRFLGTDGAGNVITNLTTTLFFLSVVAMFVIGYVVVIRRFYNNLLKNEGYFTHTIPVKTSSHVNCKIVCGLGCIFLNFIASLVALFIIASGTDFWPELSRLITRAFKVASESLGELNFTLYIVELALITLFELLLFLLQVYAAMAMGQRMKSKAGGAVLWYFIFYVIMQITNALLTSGETFVVSRLNISAAATTHVVLVTSLVIVLIWNAVYYAVTRAQLSRHLNLE